jgi:hypothetical protein
MILSQTHRAENASCIIGEAKEVPAMPVAKEFTVFLEDRRARSEKSARHSLIVE